MILATSSSPKSVSSSTKEIIAAFSEALKDKNYDVRWSTAWALGKIGPAAKDAIPDLIAALGDDNSHVRIISSESLGRIGHDAVPYLIRALGNDDVNVRHGAAIALGNIGPAAKWAIPTLEKMRDGDKNPRCRKAAREAIEKIAGD